ncbi:MAG: GHKL domain-containing protein [Treponema sp.]|nr:GHKL domain-containing protein [Treponema sp.]
MKDITTISISILIAITVLSAMFLCMQPKKTKRFTILIYILISAVIIMIDLAMERFGIISIHAFRIVYPLLLFFPFIAFLFSGAFFKKLFVFLLTMTSATTILSIAKASSCLVSPDREIRFWMVMLVSAVLMYSVHIAMVRKFGPRLVERLFAYGSTKEWALYSSGIGIYHLIVENIYPYIDKYSIIGLVALFVIWLSIVTLCYAIINTHEKTKQKYESAFARDIISSGREHYQKMNEQYNVIRIMKHDYKFHLNTALSMLRKGEIEKSDEYLSGLQTQLAEGELPFFCDNPVINSLLADYVLRCRKSNIEFDAQVSIPDGFSVPNYEMCIVLGNLLENAVEACQKLKISDKKSDCTIELTVKPQGEQLAILVRNNFDGRLAKDGDNLISTKKDGGVGLQSVKAVAGRYCESFVTEYDKQRFSAFVLWKKGDR